jgi:hypothetical protein
MYKDVHSGTSLPPIDKTALETYLEGFGVKLGDKPKELYDNRYLSYVRGANVDEKYYFRSKCHAEMRKDITYLVDAVVDKDGVVLEGQCECGAGMGPEAHCKHVQTLIYAIIQLRDTNAVKTLQTCTDTLQTFHKVKRPTGSPVKTENFKLGPTDSQFYF